MNFAKTHEKPASVTVNKDKCRVLVLQRKSFRITETKTTLSPCFGVNVVSVHVIHQAVFVVAEGLVSAVDKHAAAVLVVYAAVAVASLDQRPAG